MAKKELDDIAFYTITDAREIEGIKDEISYLIGKDGIYLKRKNSIIDSITKVEEIPHLADIEESCKFVGLPKKARVPLALVDEATAFFKKVYSLYQSEAILMLLFDGKKWGLYCPQQKVSEASLDYDLKNENLNGSKIVGTIHSHADMEAFHSGGDDDDEKNFDGIHITVGNVDSMPSLSCSVVSGGVRTQVEAGELIEEGEGKSFNKAWLSKVSKARGFSIPKITTTIRGARGTRLVGTRSGDDGFGF